MIPGITLGTKLGKIGSNFESCQARGRSFQRGRPFPVEKGRRTKARRDEKQIQWKLPKRVPNRKVSVEKHPKGVGDDWKRKSVEMWINLKKENLQKEGRDESHMLDLLHFLHSWSQSTHSWMKEHSVNFKSVTRPYFPNRKESVNVQNLGVKLSNAKTFAEIVEKPKKMTRQGAFRPAA